MADRMTVEQRGTVLEFNVPTVGVLRFDVTYCDEATRQRAMYHGFKQKIADAAAIEYKLPDGRVRKPTWGEKAERMAGVIQNLRNSQWNATREGAGATGGIFVQAMMEYRPEKFPTAESVRVWVENSAKAQNATRAAVEKSLVARVPELKAIVDRLTAERTDEGLADALIEELGL